MLAYGGQIPCEPRSVDLGGVAHEAVRLHRTSFPEDVALQLDLSKTPVAVLADTTFLGRILSNLLTNARQAVGGGGRVTVRTRAVERRDLLDDGPWLGELPRGPVVGLLEVADDGVGMDATTRERMFEPFFSTRGVGRGMGLASSLGLLGAMGGAVRVGSEPGRGTRVEVALPLSQELPEPVAVPREASMDGGVLVVDDEVGVRRITGAMLERLGFHPVLVEDGEKALEALGQRDFRAVLVDVEMPGLSGERLVRRIRELAPDLPLVAVSGYDPGTVHARLGPEAVQAFVQKPYTRADLAEALRRVLGDRGVPGRAPRR
jgi:CheY-like chemotaxis protein